MLLPLAQALANWHAQTHWDLERSGQSEKQDGVPGKLCDLCVIAAAVTGGAAVDTTPAPSLQSTPDAAPAMHGAGPWCAPVLAAYQSRAPPAASV